MQTIPNYIPASQETGRRMQDLIMDIYINGVWTAFYAIENVQMHKIKFNDKPLDIGCAIDGEIGNFRYFNWRLSAEEVMKNYLNQRPFC
ncbi:hypothetical protein RhiirA1_420445 [Rhizophagus irregularis]|uniref:Uncharacterized protein n=1 Tax=Rhizophagus irregularis TaxID=588596 RepID=A0A2N0RQ26_9GLOM|nr:hypothetical protein RhiirA1_420445 [Rhizophagus irregularis]